MTDATAQVDAPALLTLDQAAASLQVDRVTLWRWSLTGRFPVAVLRVSATINQDMKALYPRQGLLPEYLCVVLWALNDDALEMVDRSSHDTRKLVTPKLQAFRIPVPSPQEQRRIIAYLDDLQAKVDSLKALQAQSAAELDALLPSILDKAFKGEL